MLGLIDSSVLLIVATRGIRLAKRSVQIKVNLLHPYPICPWQNTGTGCNNKHREKAFQDAYPQYLRRTS